MDIRKKHYHYDESLHCLGVQGLHLCTAIGVIKYKYIIKSTDTKIRACVIKSKY